MARKVPVKTVKIEIRLGSKRRFDIWADERTGGITNNAMKYYAQGDRDENRDLIAELLAEVTRAYAAKTPADVCVDGKAIKKMSDYE